MGRIVIFIVGAVCVTVSATYGYFVRDSSQLLVAGVFGVGILFLVISFAASDRFAGRFGFELPWFLS